MKMQAYDDILASLDRAIALIDQQPERLVVERDAYDKLKEIRARVADAKAKASRKKKEV